MILLTREEAEAVLGPSPTAPESALEPAPLMDGTYVLPEDVIADPANADVEAFLTDHVVPGDPDPALVWDFGTPDNPNEHDIIAYNQMKLVWSEGGAQRSAAYAATQRKASRKR
jgi:hypothetical protein